MSSNSPEDTTSSQQPKDGNPNPHSTTSPDPSDDVSSPTTPNSPQTLVTPPQPQDIPRLIDLAFSTDAVSPGFIWNSPRHTSSRPRQSSPLARGSLPYCNPVPPPFLCDPSVEPPQESNDSVPTSQNEQTTSRQPEKEDIVLGDDADAEGEDEEEDGDDARTIRLGDVQQDIQESTERLADDVEDLSIDDPFAWDDWSNARYSGPDYPSVFQPPSSPSPASTHVVPADVEDDEDPDAEDEDFPFILRPAAEFIYEDDAEREEDVEESEPIPVETFSRANPPSHINIPSPLRLQPGQLFVTNPSETSPTSPEAPDTPEPTTPTNPFSLSTRSDPTMTLRKARMRYYYEQIQRFPYITPPRFRPALSKRPLTIIDTPRQSPRAEIPPTRVRGWNEEENIIDPEVVGYMKKRKSDKHPKESLFKKMKQRDRLLLELEAEKKEQEEWENEVTAQLPKEMDNPGLGLFTRHPPATSTPPPVAVPMARTESPVTPTRPTNPPEFPSVFRRDDVDPKRVADPLPVASDDWKKWLRQQNAHTRDEYFKLKEPTRQGKRRPNRHRRLPKEPGIEPLQPIILSPSVPLKQSPYLSKPLLSLPEVSLDTMPDAPMEIDKDGAKNEEAELTPRLDKGKRKAVEMDFSPRYGDGDTIPRPDKDKRRMATEEDEAEEDRDHATPRQEYGRMQVDARMEENELPGASTTLSAKAKGKQRAAEPENTADDSATTRAELLADIMKYFDREALAAEDHATPPRVYNIGEAGPSVSRNARAVKFIIHTGERNLTLSQEPRAYTASSERQQEIIAEQWEIAAVIEAEKQQKREKEEREKERERERGSSFLDFDDPGPTITVNSPTPSASTSSSFSATYGSDATLHPAGATSPEIRLVEPTPETESSETLEDPMAVPETNPLDFFDPHATGRYSPQPELLSPPPKTHGKRRRPRQTRSRSWTMGDRLTRAGRNGMDEERESLLPHLLPSPDFKLDKPLKMRGLTDQETESDMEFLGRTIHGVLDKVHGKIVNGLNQAQSWVTGTPPSPRTRQTPRQPPPIIQLRSSASSSQSPILPTSSTGVRSPETPSSPNLTTPPTPTPATGRPRLFRSFSTSAVLTRSSLRSSHSTPPSPSREDIPMSPLVASRPAPSPPIPSIMQTPPSPALSASSTSSWGPQPRRRYTAQEKGKGRAVGLDEENHES